MAWIFTTWPAAGLLFSVKSPETRNVLPDTGFEVDAVAVTLAADPGVGCDPVAAFAAPVVRTAAPTGMAGGDQGAGDDLLGVHESGCFR